MRYTAIPFDKFENQIIYNIVDEENTVYFQILSTPNSILEDVGLNGRTSITDMLEDFNISVSSVLSRLQVRAYGSIHYIFKKHCKLLKLQDKTVVRMDAQTESYSSV